ncbi:hypothetical protein QBC44DRAFT_85802 [Cladorrhinum sp. PSN332]|nr:hypothetical protein QBC44DRAFT_85802 [Cladorrhinum sp. PSN332]
MTFWEKLQLKANRANNKSSRGSSESSHDSGYASFGTSFEQDDDKNSVVSASSTLPAERLKTGSRLESVPEPRSAEYQHEAMPEPATPGEAPEGEAPIDISMHRAARGIVCNFRRSFGNQLARHLNSPHAKAAGHTPHAIAIFPTVSWRKGWLNSQVAVEIIIQCHPAAETHIKQFLKERRTAIDSFLMFARKREPKSIPLWVEIRVVGREITFLSQPSVYMQPSKRPGQHSELPGRPVVIDLGNGQTVSSTLGGLVSVTPGPGQDPAWFGMTTSHGIQGQFEGPLEAGNSPLALIIGILQVLEHWETDAIARMQSAEKKDKDGVLLDLLRGCGHAIKAFTRARCLDAEKDIAIEESSIGLLKAIHSWLKRAPELHFKEQESDLVSIVASLSAASNEAEDEKVRTKLKENDRNLQLGQHVGYTSLTSTDLLQPADVEDLSAFLEAENFGEDFGESLEQLDEGNLDWTLLDLVHARSESYPLSDYRNDVFEPSDPSVDIEDTPKVILLNRDKGYPEAQICPQVAFLSFPPSMELVELLTFKLNGSERLSSGDSGSWIISVDASGTKVVHGQVVAVNSMGDGLLMPMESIVGDIRAKLSPIFEPLQVELKTHVPMDAVNLEDMADFVREWAVSRLDENEQLLAWRFMKLGLDAALALWKKTVQEATFRTFSDQYATERWTSQEKELERELPGWKRHLEMWEANQRLGSLLSNEWVNGRIAKRQLWYDRAMEWNNHLQIPIGKGSRVVDGAEEDTRLSCTAPLEMSLSWTEVLQRRSGRSRATGARSNSGSLCKSNSSRGTGSYRSMWSSPSSVGTELSSRFDYEPDFEHFDTIQESENECDIEL